MRQTLDLRIFIHTLQINLCILGLVSRELNHSNLYMRYQRLTSKGSLSWETVNSRVLLKQWRKFRCGRGAIAPPPSVNRHSLSEIFGFVGIFKTIEYTGINKNNYWCGRQLICTERIFDYLEAICLI